MHKEGRALASSADLSGQLMLRPFGQLDPTNMIVLIIDFARKPATGRPLLNGGIMKKLAFNLLAVAAFVGLASGAEAKGWGGELTVAKAEDQWGAELGVGYGAAIGPVTIRPVAGAFLYRGDNSRYYEQTFSNGQSRCRDRSNGQFASSCVFRKVPDTDFGKSRTVISQSPGQAFR